MWLVCHRLSPAVCHEPVVFFQTCCIYLGRPWLHPLCCRAQCQIRCRGRCYGRDYEGLRREVRDMGLDKGLTKVLYFLPGISACGYCVALFCYSTRMNQCHGLVAAFPDLSTFTNIVFIKAETRIPEKICRNQNHNKEKGEGSSDATSG